jgi:hypothetical protein
VTEDHFDLLCDLKDLKLPFNERYRAALDINRAVLYRAIGSEDVALFFEPMVDFWRRLNLISSDCSEERLFSIRARLANICRNISRKLQGRQKFFRYFPQVKRAEGFDDRVMNRLITGEIKPGYGTSLYEFHREYPIEGIGIRKDLISVIIDNDQKIPIMEWCRQNDVVVFCNRCGLDITYEVSSNCPYINRRIKKSAI